MDEWICNGSVSIAKLWVNVNTSVSSPVPGEWHDYGYEQGDVYFKHFFGYDYN